MRAGQGYPDGMATTDLIAPEPRRFSIPLPRPFWIFLAAVVMGTAYAAGFWIFFWPGPTFEIGGVKYSLDVERAITRARLNKMPVLLYFTGVNCVNSRKMERGALRAPPVVDRLRQFTCAAAFVDQVPYFDATLGKRLAEDNLKLEERLLEDVALPAFVVIRPDFDLAGPSDPRKPLATSIGIVGEAEFVRFLDAALADWDATRRSESDRRNE